jgi:hypothetical protein
MIDNKITNYYIKNTNNYNKNKYIFATFQNIIEKIWEHKTCSKPLQHLQYAIQTKLVWVCYIFKKIVHGRPDLDKNIVTSRICFRYKKILHICYKNN